MLPFILRPPASPVLPVTAPAAPGDHDNDNDSTHSHDAIHAVAVAVDLPPPPKQAPRSPPPTTTPPPAAAARPPLPTASGLANPAPLGLIAFGVTTCLLMFRTAGWVEGGHVGLVIAFAIALGGLMQMLAGVVDFVRGDAFGASAFSLYGAFWIAWALLQVMSSPRGPALLDPPSAFRTGETLFLSLFAVLTAGLFVPTMRKSIGLMYVFASLALTFALLAGGVWSPACSLAAGYVGFACGVGAIVTAFATLYKETLGWNPRWIRPIRLI